MNGKGGGEGKRGGDGGGEGEGGGGEGEGGGGEGEGGGGEGEGGKNGGRGGDDARHTAPRLLEQGKSFQEPASGEGQLRWAQSSFPPVSFGSKEDQLE